MILTRKSHNCAGTVFVQGESAGGSKLIEQTLTRLLGTEVTYFLKTEKYNILVSSSRRTYKRIVSLL